MTLPMPGHSGLQTIDTPADMKSTTSFSWTIKRYKSDRGTEPPWGRHYVPSIAFQKIERSQLSKRATSDRESGQVRAVLGMRRRCPKGCLKRMWARQDYGAGLRLQDSPITTLPEAAGAGDLA